MVIYSKLKETFLTIPFLSQSELRVYKDQTKIILNMGIKTVTIFWRHIPSLSW